jgi:uncharacterized membrane protein
MKSLGKVILEIVETKNPKNVRELVQLVQEQVEASLNDVVKEVKNLQRNGLVVLEELEESTTPRHNFINLMSSKKSLWFWMIVSLAFLAFVSIIFFPETGTPLSYVRYAFGFILAVFLPGYCLTETLFPRKNSIDEIERLTYSVGLSFAVTALVGLFLSLTPFGLTLTTALLTLGSIVVVLALVALNRKYKAE